MIVKTNTTTTTPRWLRTGAWIAVVCALPLGIVYCDQPETPAAPDDRVMEAPAAAQANDAAQAGDTDDAAALDARRAERVAALRRDLGAMVRAGEITGEQAEDRMAAVRRLMVQAQSGDADGEASADEANDGMPARYDEAVREVQAMLDAGKITEEQARERFEGLRRRLAGAAARGRTPDGNR